MFLASKILATLIAMNQVVHIGYVHLLVETLPVRFAHKCSHTCVASANS
jgi:hypothetical protein